jgi:hypothetical protein
LLDYKIFPIFKDSVEIFVQYFYFDIFMEQKSWLNLVNTIATTINVIPSVAEVLKYYFMDKLIPLREKIPCVLFTVFCTLTNFLRTIDVGIKTSKPKISIESKCLSYHIESQQLFKTPFECIWGENISKSVFVFWLLSLVFLVWKFVESSWFIYGLYYEWKDGRRLKRWYFCFNHETRRIRIRELESEPLVHHND